MSDTQDGIKTSLSRVNYSQDILVPWNKEVCPLNQIGIEFPVISEWLKI